MTETRRDLIDALIQVQNHPIHSHHDILTITGCGMDDAEVRKHLEWNIEMIQRWSETPKRARGRKR